MDKTCNDINRMLWKYRGLLSRKCNVKIHGVMVSNAYKIYLFFDRSDANGSGESGLEQ